jgi:hypothetical protein
MSVLLFVMCGSVGAEGSGGGLGVIEGEVTTASLYLLHLVAVSACFGAQSVKISSY